MHYTLSVLYSMYNYMTAFALGFIPYIEEL